MCISHTCGTVSMHFPPNNSHTPHVHNHTRTCPHTHMMQNILPAQVPPPAQAPPTPPPSPHHPRHPYISSFSTLPLGPTFPHVSSIVPPPPHIPLRLALQLRGRCSLPLLGAPPGHPQQGCILRPPIRRLLQHWHWASLLVIPQQQLHPEPHGYWIPRDARRHHLPASSTGQRLHVGPYSPKGIGGGEAGLWAGGQHKFQLNGPTYELPGVILHPLTGQHFHCVLLIVLGWNFRRHIWPSTPL